MKYFSFLNLFLEHFDEKCVGILKLINYSFKVTNIHKIFVKNPIGKILKRDDKYMYDE